MFLYTFDGGDLAIPLGQMVSVATLNLPGPATYLLSAKLNVGASAPYVAHCYLNNTATYTGYYLDFGQVSFPFSGSYGAFGVMSLLNVVTVPSSGMTVSLSCEDYPQAASPSSVQITQIRLLATPVGGVN